MRSKGGGRTLALRYNPAYIDPVQDTESSAVQGLVTFLRNFDEDDDNGKPLWDQAKAARNLCPPGPDCISAPNYWTVMVVSAWQGKEANDYDPNTEMGGGSGILLGINTHEDGATTSFISPSPSYSGICAVFKAVFEEAGLTNREQYTVTLEIGHTLGLPHNNLNTGDPPIGMMDPFGDGQTLPMIAVNLRRLREYTGP